MADIIEFRNDELTPGDRKRLEEFVQKELEKGKGSHLKYVRGRETVI